MSLIYRVFLLIHVVLLSSCGGVWNSPYESGDSNKKILYSSFSSSPKHLDPARSYSSDEHVLIENIYEPPLQYHYLDRPYRLIPLTAKSVPEERVEEVDGKTYYVYDIFLKSEIFYAPHPAFGNQKRELNAKDYAYQIKRLADSRNHSPIASVMAKYIQGFSEYRKAITDQSLDLEESASLPMAGVKVISPYHYQVRLVQKYPQFKYWLAMPFFAPMPYEVIAWHHKKKQQDANHLGVDWNPIGTGPFMMTENNPNYRMVLSKNPNFHQEKFPTFKQKHKAYLPEDTTAFNGKKLPLLEKIIYTLEKESVPYWQKFLQGYYDASGLASDNFDQAIELSNAGAFALSKEFKNKSIQLRSQITTSIYYLGFNMLSDKIGGYDEKHKKIRQAISIALDYEEYIAIFANSRGVIAQGPIAPGIFGYLTGEQGINRWVYDWKEGRAQRKSIAAAKNLLSQAGYPNGIDSVTGKQLSINYEAVGSAGDSRERLEWMRRQLSEIGIKMNIRLTDYNRFREKIIAGKAELFGWGWNADYPDPENFLFLLYGPNGKVKHKGENASNYQNEEYDALYEKMVLMPNTPERLAIIQKMVNIVREDSPWVWGWHPMAVGLYHQWVNNAIPNSVSRNTLKYRSIDEQQRVERVYEWNKPKLFPMIVFISILLIMFVVTVMTIRKRQHRKTKSTN
jgi:ABC-type transport system substrate-binding protein